MKLTAIIGALVCAGSIAHSQEMEVMRTNYTMVGEDGTGYYFMPNSEMPNVVAWGSNPTLTAVPSNLTNAIAISANYDHCIALKSDGTVEGWGSDFWGQCDEPVGIFPNSIVQIMAGNGWSAAVISDGSVSIWGVLGTTSVSANETLSKGVSAIAAATTNSFLALMSDGSVEIYSNFVEYPTTISSATAIAAESSVPAQAQYIAILGSGSCTNWGFQNHTNQTSAANGASEAAISTSYAAAIVGSNAVCWKTGAGNPFPVTTNGMVSVSGFSSDLWSLDTNGLAHRLQGVITAEPAGNLPFSQISVGQNVVLGMQTP